MPITYLYFYFIVAIIMVIYYAFPQRIKWIILLIASFLLYTIFGGKRAMFFMLSGAIAAYIGAIGIAYFREKQRESAARIYFRVALIIIIGILAWHNYLNFFIENFNYGIRKLGGGDFQIPVIQALAPLGISFYSLSLISYLIDVYWGIQEAEKNIGKVILYGCYFPVVTTGPILKYNKFHEQITNKITLDYENICFALQRILWGVFKKAVLADYFYIIVQEVFANDINYAGSIVLATGYLSSIQLYLNFSASIDIVLGISQLFGIELPENFNRPFSSCTITELFRRWHISLGNWLKDYIYYPLMKSSFLQSAREKVGKKFGKKAGKKVSTFGAMLIMWMMNGVWHGAKWKYIIGVGLLLWGIMLLEDLFEPYRLKMVRKVGIKESSKIYLWIRRAFMYTKFSIMMIFFSADGVIHGIKILYHMIKNFFVKPNFAFLLDLGFSTERIIIIGLEFCIYLWIVHIASKTDVRKWLASRKIWFRWSIYYLIILSILLFSANGTDVMEGFIYAQF